MVVVVVVVDDTALILKRFCSEVNMKTHIYETASGYLKGTVPNHYIPTYSNDIYIYYMVYIRPYQQIFREQLLAFGKGTRTLVFIVG